jgi:hypothetical protein
MPIAEVVAASAAAGRRLLRRHRPSVRRRRRHPDRTKLFSDSFTLKSDIGNLILRQTPIMVASRRGVTWIEGC